MPNQEEAVAVGQTYRRVRNGRSPVLKVDVVQLNKPREGWATCRMYDTEGRSYGTKPVPLDLLKSEEFAHA